MFRIIIFTIAFGLTSVQAQTPDDSAMVALLTDFYQALNGDDWHNNDGWLDPDTHYCDWYGITCELVNESNELIRLRLSNNNLHGEFPQGSSLVTSLFYAREINLSGNAISGTPVINRLVEYVNYADNLLSGSLADAVSPHPNLAIDPPAPNPIRHLLLSGNELSGSIPDWLDFMLLGSLDLSGNQFSSGAEFAFAALEHSTLVYLDLSDNPLVDIVPDWITAIDFQPHTFGLRRGGLNLCWTDLEIPNEEVAEFIAAHHTGGESYALCQGHSRQPVDRTLSGSWYDPSRSGEGLTMMLMENGQVLTYWFSHLSRGRQAWFFNLGTQAEVQLTTPVLLRTRGRFDQGFGDVDSPLRSAGSLGLNRIADDQLIAEFDLWYTNRDFETDFALSTVIPFPVSRIQNYRRLSELAGTRCDNGTLRQNFSGLWYNPERNGEGFIVEILSHSRALVYWFTHVPDDSGEQAWMIGDGVFTVGPLPGVPPPPSAQLTFEQLLMPVAAEYGPDFNSEDIDLIDWGQLDINFHNDEQGEITYSSNIDGYGSGSYPIERLARPMLADCDGQTSE